MTAFKKRHLFTALFVLEMGATVSLAPEAAAQSSPTVSQCTQAWNGSSAADSCGLHQVHNLLAQISVTSSGECSVTVDCSMSHWGQHRTASFTGSVTEMGQLHNCNGNLQVGGC